MIGPPRAGKTCVLAALEPACYAGPLDDDGQLNLRHGFTVDGQSLLSGYTVDWVTRDEDPHSTLGCTDYMLEVTVQARRPGFRSSQRVTTIQCTDTPGDLLFPKQGTQVNVDLRNRLLGQAKEASSIILVLDSTASSAELVERQLRSILDSITSLSGPENPGFWRRLLRWIPQRPQVGRHVPLASVRFLILLTQIDKLAHSVSRQLREQDLDVSPLAVAKAIDPVALALELIGERNLRRIWSVMGRRARLAVGVSSARGFLRGSSGQTFTEWSAGRDAQERLGAWSSFGVYEALRFITTGRCGGPVKRVHDLSELVRERALPLDSFPFMR
ncbi:hypothetical protein [Hyalangium gracile]|uniref:hypothetical protein n=1 Tax=Hyalangium gracile TaxID=394092 RepID=UPI001CCF426D|nr:hypothetical protein [Hyalangium gracile]